MRHIQYCVLDLLFKHKALLNAALAYYFTRG